ncbi:MAG: protein translocase subunit SecF, partial [Candidatus Diapherotrites archaeon]|nr:protein translocase subunit SecF [Candidatus Diapherotrites archaeon]
KEGTAIDRAADSMQTGLTMTLTAIAAVTVMAIVSSVFQIPFMFEISAVLLFGLLADIISSWFLNAPLTLMHAEKKESRAH